MNPALSLDSPELARPIKSPYDSSGNHTSPAPNHSASGKNKETPEEKALKNVRVQNTRAYLKRGVIIAAVLLLIGLFIWTNFRTVSATFTIPEGTLVISNMTPDHGSYYKLTQSGDELPTTFYVRSDLDIPLDENGEYHFSQAVIRVRIPVGSVWKDNASEFGTLLNHETSAMQKSAVFSTEYMKYIYVTDITG